MNHLELITASNQLFADIQRMIEKHLVVCDNDFSSMQAGNEMAAMESEMYHNMHQYLIYSTLTSMFKKSYDQTKLNMDMMSVNLGKSNLSEPSTTRTIISVNNLTFKKKQNKDSESIKMVDFVTELAKAGVDRDVVRKATDAATMPKKGNTTYIVEVDD
jgi:hypothetical protein